MGKSGKIKELFLESVNIKKGFLEDSSRIEAVSRAVEIIDSRMRKGGKVLIFGNGGSASDSQHFAAELVVRFEKERNSLPCIALTTDTSILTAASNDYGYDRVFSRQIEGLAGPEDVIIAISTSGNSPNVLEAVRVAREKDLPVISLTARDGGRLAGMSDVSINVNTDITARAQEVHSTALHIICKLIEDDLS